jgi:acetyl esterase
MALHPFIEAMRQQMKMKGWPALSHGSPAQARALIAAGQALLGGGPDMWQVRDLELPTRAGQVKARLLKPREQIRGLIVYLHGGGWVVGEIDDCDAMARTLAAESGCAVLLVDYRLAPECPFPAAFEDTQDALAYAAHGVEALAGAKVPLIVAGDSAGANLGTSAIRTLGDRTLVALQVLIYPVTDCNFAMRSYAAHGDGLPLTARDMSWFFEHYAPRHMWDRPEISPLRATDLEGMPPTLIVTAEYDVLADEGAAYAERLRLAGVPVIERHITGVTHGFIRLHNLFDVARDELKAIAADITAACHACSKRATAAG